MYKRQALGGEELTLEIGDGGDASLSIAPNYMHLPNRRPSIAKPFKNEDVQERSLFNSEAYRLHSFLRARHVQ